MQRNAIRVLVVAGLLAIGWVSGRAQSTGADFELRVSASANGTAQIRCVRGCALTWGNDPNPKTGIVEIHVPMPTLEGAVNSDGAGNCMAPTYASRNCRIWGYARP